MTQSKQILNVPRVDFRNFFIAATSANELRTVKAERLLFQNAKLKTRETLMSLAMGTPDRRSLGISR